MTEARAVVSQCGIPVTVIPANPCGSNCEVVAKDSMGGMTDGPVWSFTTALGIQAGRDLFATPAGEGAHRNFAMEPIPRRHDKRTGFHRHGRW